MATQLPVPIRFDLSMERWIAVPPGSAAFTAVHRGEHPRFTPTIVVDGAQLASEAGLPEVADLAVRQLATVGAQVNEVGRELVGSESAPGLTHIVEFTLDPDDDPMAVVQVGNYTLIRVGDQRWAYSFTLTTLNDDLDAVFGDYETMLSSIRPPQDEA